MPYEIAARFSEYIVCNGKLYVATVTKARQLELYKICEDHSALQDWLKVNAAVLSREIVILDLRPNGPFINLKNENDDRRKKTRDSL